MHVKVWGARGSIPSPGPETVRYGGNTSCVQVTLSDGSDLVLDAGTGIRNLGELFAEPDRRIHILLTHLHLDHIQGLLFFSPLFRRQAHVTIWGPAAPGGSLQDRISRYLSAPLTPVEVRELPCDLAFRDCPASEWDLGPARVRAEAVNHRGPTLGFHVSDGDASLCYIPDHEPALAGPLDQLEPEWLSGYSLAHDVDLLIHDCQYTDAEYAGHVGWGHSAVGDALRFARRSNARHTLLFHHDPHRTDEQLDQLLESALEEFRGIGGAGSLEFAAEQRSIDVLAAQAAAG
jgi:phosphoribosyl 1,2-cyclic phosphodiesterase